MGKKQIFLAAAFIAGLLVGGGTIEVLHLRASKQSYYVFQQRIRCRKLANDYAAKQGSFVLLEKVDFGTRRNSCVAEFDRLSKEKVEYWTVDLLTGEILYSGSCDVNANCFDGKTLQLKNDAFERALTSSSQ